MNSYISDLLYRYECVTVPGFGAFLSHKVSAHIDDNTNTFFPPKKRLSFNSQLKDNDGLLAKYIAKAEGISYEEALKSINSFQRYLSTELESKKFVELDNIGSLSLTETGTLRFEPNNKVNYLPEAFGLASYSAKPVARELYKKEVAALEEKTPVTFSQDKRNAPAWLKYAAIGLIALGVSGSGGYMYLKNIENHNFAQKQKAEDQLDAQIQRATFTIDNPLPAVTINAFKPTGKYHIIAGAFRVKENAQTRVDQLREKGYKARKIGQNKYGLHQVVYGSYADRLEALRSLHEVRENDNSSAWILVQELD
ncbi:MAG: SPOR domain-containing protein [Leeuwenhoekiella sp.]